MFDRATASPTRALPTSEPSTAGASPSRTSASSPAAGIARAERFGHRLGAGPAIQRMGNGDEDQRNWWQRNMPYLLGGTARGENRNYFQRNLPRFLGGLPEPQPAPQPVPQPLPVAAPQVQQEPQADDEKEHAASSSSSSSSSRRNRPRPKRKPKPKPSSSASSSAASSSSSAYASSSSAYPSSAFDSNQDDEDDWEDAPATRQKKKKQQRQDKHTQQREYYDKASSEEREQWLSSEDQSGKGDLNAAYHSAENAAKHAIKSGGSLHTARASLNEAIELREQAAQHHGGADAGHQQSIDFLRARRDSIDEALDSVD